MTRPDSGVGLMARMCILPSGEGNERGSFLKE